jgi:hypothetical protein
MKIARGIRGGARLCEPQQCGSATTFPKNSKASFANGMLRVIDPRSDISLSNSQLTTIN